LRSTTACPPHSYDWVGADVFRVSSPLTTATSIQNALLQGHCTLTLIAQVTNPLVSSSAKLATGGEGTQEGAEEVQLCHHNDRVPNIQRVNNSQHQQSKARARCPHTHSKATTRPPSPPSVPVLVIPPARSRPPNAPTRLPLPPSLSSQLSFTSSSYPPIAAVSIHPTSIRDPSLTMRGDGGSVRPPSRPH